MITSALARSHAVATDKAILYGTAGVTAGIAGGNGNDKGTGFRASTSATTAQLDGTTPFGTSMLEAGRAAMGKYAVNPTDVVYVVSIDAYYDILAEDGDFRTVDKAGSDASLSVVCVELVLKLITKLVSSATFLLLVKLWASRLLKASMAHTL